MSFESQIALDFLGITDPAQQQTVVDAIPVAQKLIQHIDDNKQLFETLWADIKLVLPAAKIVIAAVKAKAGT